MKENPLLVKSKEQISFMHKTLDAFIQATLDKFSFVDPWKDLYDVTGQYAYYIISNQSTIPDLVIFNKGFNKNECYVESQAIDYNKFPRKHFILHIKQQKEKEKNQSSTVQFDTFIEEKKKVTEEKTIMPIQSQFQSQKQFGGQLKPQFHPQPKLQLQQSLYQQPSHQPLNQQKGKKKIIESDEEEDPEWGDDDVTEFKKTKVNFKEIPLELQKESDDINNEEIKIEAKHKDKKKVDTQMPIQIPSLKDLNVITGDELFQVDSELLFNAIPENIANAAYRNTTQKTNNKGPQIKESQLKKENEFFKDLCSNEKQNDTNPLLDLDYNNSNSNSSNIWSNQRNPYFDQQTNNINSNTTYNMYMVNAQMKQMMMNNNNQYIPIPIQQMPFPQMMNNRMGSPSNFQAIQMQQMNMWPQYPSPIPIPNQNQINMIRQNMQSINNTQSNMSPFNYFNTNFPIPNQMQSGEEDGTNRNMVDPTANANDDDDDLMSDFNTKYNLYNPSVFLENPGLIVKKNLFEANWFLMKDNKIIGNYNSEELFFFLSEKINDKEKLEDVSISDYHTDVFFKPTNLLEILKEFVPKIKKKLELKQKQMASFQYPYNQQEQNYIQMHNNDNAVNNNTNNKMMMMMMSQMNINNNCQQNNNNYYN